MQKVKLLRLFLFTSLLTFTCQVQAQMCSLQCPAQITLGEIIVDAAPNQCGAVVTWSPALTSGNCGVLHYSHASGSFFPVGTTTVTVTGLNASCTFTVSVIDKQAPVISGLSAVPASLWPPNHKLNDVAVNYSVSDNCPGPIGCTISVSSNEPANSTGDGNTSPDWIIVNAHQVQLRAERKGNGEGRIYTIAVTCTDQHFRTTTKTTTINVVHDMSGKVRSEVIGSSDINERAIENALTVQPLHNPTRSEFAIKISSNVQEKIIFRLLDVNGRVVESNNNIRRSEMLRFGNQLSAGIYFAEIRQGKNVKRLTLVKE